MRDCRYCTDGRRVRRQIRCASAVVIVSTLMVGCTSSTSNSTSPSGSTASSAATSAGSAASGTTPTGPSAGSSATPGGAALGFEQVKIIDPEGIVLPVPQPSSVATPQGDGSATCAAGTSIALMGPFKGEYADAVMPLHDGAMLAVDQFTGANPGCRVTAKEFDTGNAQQAAAVAAEIIADPTILAVIGPAFSEEVTAAGAAFSAAGMVAASATATLPDLTTNGWTTFFRGLGTDADRPDRDRQLPGG